MKKNIRILDDADYTLCGNNQHQYLNSTKLLNQPDYRNSKNAVDLQSDTQCVQASGNFWLHHESNQVRSVDFRKQRNAINP